MYMIYFLAVPLVFAVIACATNRYIFKAMQTMACFFIVAAAGLILKTASFWPLAAAFVVSAAGDYFLSYYERNKNYFVIGIAAYLLAHLGYLMYIVKSFEINALVAAATFAALAAGFLAYYFVSLKKKLEGALNAAVLIYLLISCAVLALSAAMNTSPLVYASVLTGIALIVISDTIIAECEFMGRKKLEFLILPTYYAAQILLSASYILSVF